MQINIIQINNGWLVAIQQNGQTATHYEVNFDAVVAGLQTLNEASKKAMTEANDQLAQGQTIQFPLRNTNPKSE